jgi:hypothetical protein
MPIKAVSSSMRCSIWRKKYPVNLAGLLASAMMTGYFLRQMEQRMELETALIGIDSFESDPSDPGPLNL